MKAVLKKINFADKYNSRLICSETPCEQAGLLIVFYVFYKALAHECALWLLVFSNKRPVALETPQLFNRHCGQPLRGLSIESVPIRFCETFQTSLHNLIHYFYSNPTIFVELKN